MLSDLRVRLRALFRRTAVEGELDDELHFHFDQQVEKYVRAGLTREEAMRRVRLDFGGFDQVKEECRDARGSQFVETLAQDVRYGLRMLRKSPGFTAVALLTLTLGIGANTAIYSLVSAVLLHPLPFRDPGKLMWVWCTRVDREKAFASIPNFYDYRDQNRVLDGLAAFGFWNPNLTGVGSPERLQGIRISAGAFELLGASALKGRTLLPQDDDPAAAKVVVLSYGLWQKLGGDATLIGKSLNLNDESYLVVGVLPRNFLFPITAAQLAIPLRPESDPRRFDRGDRFLRLLGRVKGDVTQGEAQAQLSTIAIHMSREYPKTNAKDTGVKLVPLQQEITGNFRLALLVLLGAVGLVLLMVCSNLANLLISRATARRKEMAIRVALGGARARLIRQLLTESMLLACIGGALGVALATWSIPPLLALTPLDLPRSGEIHPDAGVLAFALGVSVVAGLLFGVAPAIRATQTDINEELKGGGRGSSDGAQHNRLREMLVMAEVAASLVLLIAAGLFLKSFARIQAVDPGFDPAHLLTVRLSLPKGTYQKTGDLMVFYRRLRANLLRLPGVQGAGAISGLPLGGAWATTDFTIEGHPPASPTDVPSAQYRFVTPGYFAAMRIPVLSGRDLDEADTAEVRKVACISQTLAKRFFPDGNAVGAFLVVDNGKPNPPPIEIVGIVGDVKHLSLDASPTADIYIPLEQMPQEWVLYLTNNMHWVVRYASDPMALAPSVGKEIENVDGNIAASNLWTMEQVLARSVAQQRFNMLLLAVFAMAALVLAALGVYGVMSYAVAQRSHEIGVRMALGALPRDVLWLLVGRGLSLSLWGVCGGLVAALVVMRLTRNLLYNVGPADFLTFLGVSMLLLIVAVLASYIPARRAMRVDPIVALRYE
ncbi:MAG: ABC transporter permease [Candidatus Acidiferrales bacterium]